jgi:hypothetical protein
VAPFIDVISSLQETNGETQFTCTFERLLENVVGTPINAHEHSAICSFQSDQVVTTIVGWSKNHTFVRLGKEFCGFGKSRRRHSGTVGVDQADRSKSDPEQILCGESETLTNRSAALRHELKIGRENVAISVLSADRREAANSSRTFARQRNRAGGITKKTNVYVGRFLRREWRSKSRLHLTGTRGFRHDREGALPERIWIGVMRVKDAVRSVHCFHCHAKLHMKV